MTRTNQDVESYLARLERPFEQLDEGTFLLFSGGMPLAIRVSAPLVVVRADVTAVPAGAAETAARLYRRLLELNASDLVHASYGIEGAMIVLTASLELDNLDLNELEAVLADMDLAIARHVPELEKLS